MEILTRCIVALCIFSISHANYKRILVNDQDISQRIHQLEITLQKAVGEISVLTQENTVMEKNLHDANTQISKLQSSLQDSNVKISQLQSAKHKGAIYTRWGRKECPTNGTQMIYSGTVGGSYYDSTGGPADYLCLPHDPDFLNGDTAITNLDWVSSLYGAEYEDNYFGPHVNDDVPCAVCRAVHRSSSLMIPGKTNCSNGWHIEYFGRMAASANHFNDASQYICVDHNAKSLEAGGADKNGKLLYAVRAVCGSLRCPPFYDNALLTCVVCSN